MTRNSPFSLVRCCLAAVLLCIVWQTVAVACPNCKDAMASDPAQAGFVRGLFWSILFMVSMPFLILGGVGSYFYWEVCRARRVASLGDALAAGTTEPTSLHELDSVVEEEMEPVAVG